MNPDFAKVMCELALPDIDDSPLEEYCQQESIPDSAFRHARSAMSTSVQQTTMATITSSILCPREEIRFEISVGQGEQGVVRDDTKGDSDRVRCIRVVCIRKKETENSRV